MNSDLDDGVVPKRFFHANVARLTAKKARNVDMTPIYKEIELAADKGLVSYGYNVEKVVDESVKDMVEDLKNNGYDASISLSTAYNGKPTEIWISWR